MLRIPQSGGVLPYRATCKPWNCVDRTVRTVVWEVGCQLMGNLLPDCIWLSAGWQEIFKGEAKRLNNLFAED